MQEKTEMTEILWHFVKFLLSYDHYSSQRATNTCELSNYKVKVHTISNM